MVFTKISYLSGFFKPRPSSIHGKRFLSDLFSWIIDRFFMKKSLKVLFLHFD